MRSAFNVVTVLNASPGNVLVGPNPRRKALFFGASTIGNYFVSCDPITAANRGVEVPTNQTGLWLTEEMIGETIKNAWIGFAAVFNTVATIIEVVD